MSAQKNPRGGLVKNGILRNNPLLRLGLGLSPALAIVTTAPSAFAIGVTTAFVLILTSLAMGLIGGAIPEKVRIPVALVCSATLSTVSFMVLQIAFASMTGSMGLYGPLIVVSSLILSRAGTFAPEHGVRAALADSIGMGIGYLIALLLIGALRELLGNGTLFGRAILPASFQPVLLATLPAGGLMIAGILMGAANAIGGRRRDDREEA